MAKTKKYKMKKKEEYEGSESNESKEIESRFPKKSRTPEQISEYKKLALLLVGWSILSASIYIACVQLEFYPIMPIYTIAAAALFLVWLIFNGGFKKVDVTKYERPEEMGYDEFCKFIDQLKERQKKAKYFLALFFPLVVIMLLDWYINLRKL
ncbi:MAG: hypothetical protein FWH48_00905 [Oscillospiraceae bacterium]|nr:hypothetical protein [Oscillospiraceae bacterium]